MRLSLRGCPFSSPDGWPSADAASTSTGAARCAAMRSSRFDSSRATMPRATLMSVPLDTNSTNCSARFFSRCSRSLCLLRRWRLLGGFGGESPASAGSSVGATASVGFSFSFSRHSRHPSGRPVLPHALKYMLIHASIKLQRHVKRASAASARSLAPPVGAGRGRTRAQARLWHAWRPSALHCRNPDLGLIRPWRIGSRFGPRVDQAASQRLLSSLSRDYFRSA